MENKQTAVEWLATTASEILQVSRRTVINWITKIEKKC